MHTLIERIKAAIDTFREPQRYLIVEQCRPLGWCVLYEVDDYDAAHEFRAERYPDNKHVRVMVESEWRRRTLELMATREPWLALSKLNAEVLTAKQDAADTAAMSRAAVLDAYAEAKHP